MRAVIHFGLRVVRVSFKFSGSWIQRLFCLEILVFFCICFRNYLCLCLCGYVSPLDLRFCYPKIETPIFFVLELTFCVESGPLVLHLGLLGFIWDSWAPFGTPVTDRLTNAVRSTQTDRLTDRQTDRQTASQPARQTDRPTDRGDWQRASNGQIMNGQLKISCCYCCCCCCSR